MSGGDIADALGGDFDPNDVDREDRGGFEPLVPGWYSVEVDKAEAKVTKNKKGQYLWLALTVVGERYNGRKLFARITLNNLNETAVKIGRGQLADLADACGLRTLSDSEQVIGQQIDVQVKVKKGDGEHDADNDVSGYAALGTKAGKEPRKKAAAPGKKKAAAWSKPKAEEPEENADEDEEGEPEEAPAKAKAKAGGKKMPWQR